MDLKSVFKALPQKLSGYGFPPEAEKAIGEYLQFFLTREDLLTLAETYYGDIFEKKSYTYGQIEALPENDGREAGLLFAVIALARYELLEGIMPAQCMPGALHTLRNLVQRSQSCYGAYGLRGMYRSGIIPYLLPYKYVIGRLCFEVTTFNSSYEVYRNPNDGTTVPVATGDYSYMPNGKRPTRDYSGELFTPTTQINGDAMTCYVFGENGRLCPEPVTLRGYEKILQSGDDVLSVHIPAGGKMSPELVDDAFRQAEAFFAAHYPEKQFKAYVCSSWLLNTDMEEFLSPESNIIKFRNRFRVVMTTPNGYSLYWHVFGIEQFLPLEQMQPANGFQKTLLDRVKAGNTLYNGYGYILR